MDEWTKDRTKRQSIMTEDLIIELKYNNSKENGTRRDLSSSTTEHSNLNYA